MKIDLDELERKARDEMGQEYALGDHPAADHEQTLALVARIRELEAALVKAAECIEGTVSSESQHDCAEDDPDWQSAQSWRELVCKGAVLP